MPNATAKKLKEAYKDIEREIVKDGKVVKETIDGDTQRAIIHQVNEEYDLAFKYNEGKRHTILQRLRLYNNQRRDDDAVGDPLLFTVFNTVLASLYDDRLLHEWEGREEGDEEVEDNLNALATYDYDIMGKAELDYYWDWDAGFFGRGLMLMMDFDRTSGVMAPVPQVLDPATFIRDPKAKSVNGYGIRREGAMRFGGWPIGATHYELKETKGFFNIDQLRKEKDTPQSLMDEVAEERDSAQKRDRFDAREEALGKFNNYEFQLMNWMTTIKGHKYLVTLGNGRRTIVRLVDVDKYNGNWPLFDRTIYPMSHDWDGVSIPDLTEDKQRARAVLLNLGLKSAKSEAMPQYLYDQTRVKNKNDLNWKHDKFIGVDGTVDNAIQPVNKSSVHQHVNVVMDVLDQAAQRATATPETQQGVPSDERKTLGEINLVSSKVDTRYSMSAKVFGWSERDFWRQWYRQYKVHFKKGIDKKIVRIRGPIAPTWRPLTRENIIAEVDPDVRIESKVISEAKRQRDQQGFAVYASVALQNPETNKNFIERQLGKLNGLSKEELDLAHPKTVDEMDAEEENEQINENELPEIDMLEDHRTHIRVHAKANDTSAQKAHLEEHKEMLMTQRRPELAGLVPQPGEQAEQPEQGFQPVNDQRPGAGLPVPATPTA